MNEIQVPFAKGYGEDCFGHLLFTLLVRRDSHCRVMGVTKHMTLDTGQMRLTAVY